MPATAQQMKQLVQVAREAVADFKEDDADLRRIAFERILDHMLTGDAPVTFEQNGAVIVDESEDDWPPKTEVRRADLVANYFGFETHDARALFDLSGRDPLLRLPPTQIPAKKTDATALIALLVAGARAALGLDTTTEHVRSALSEHDALDAGTFVTTLSGMEEIVLLGDPGRHNRVVRLKAIGVVEAKERATRLVS